MKRQNSLAIALAFVATLSVSWNAHAAEKAPVPDFTKGDKKGISHDWNLGPIGARGWIYSAAGQTSLARQILVTDIAKGSPADGVLVSGDVILGIGKDVFKGDARIEIANAVTVAETDQGRGELSLLRWRNGQTQTVQLKLAVLGSYSDTAPYDCQKSKRIFDLGCKYIAKSKMDNVSIANNLNALALLASGNEEYHPLLAEYARKVSNYKADSFASWYYGYATLFLAEYAVATRDQSVMPGLNRLAKEIALGSSSVGTWGHGFASPSGNCTGYGCMNAPGIVLLLALTVAREAGAKDPDVDRVIGKGSQFLRWYVNKGAIPYGDHQPWPGHEDNGKCSSAAVLFDLLNDREAATYFAKMSTAAYDERERGHTGNFFNVLWAMPGVSRCGPLALGAYWKEQGWYYELARGWDGRFGYQGSPEGEEEHGKYTNWDCTGAYLLTYALQRKSLYLTGKRPSSVSALSAKEVEDVIAAGRDYFASRKVGYQGRDLNQLITGLSSWSPIVRRRSALGLAQSKTDVAPMLLKLLSGADLNARYGACEALEELKGGAASAIPDLKRALRDEDVWLRIKAAEALSSIGKPAISALPDLLRQLATPSIKQDPRGMEQRYLSVALFGSRGILGRSLEGIDRDALYAAVRVGLQNEDGQARSAMTSVYRNLKFDEIKPLLPSIHKAVAEPAPSGEMFADGIRIEGLKILAKHRVEEGIDACVLYTREQNPWGSQARTPEIMKILQTYGARAKSAIPALKQVVERFEGGEKNFPKDLSRQKAQSVRDAIRAIEASSETPELIRLASSAGTAETATQRK